MIWDIDAKTSPWQSRITTPIPALSFSLNIAPSKFTFENSSLGGAFHLVLVLTSATWTEGVAVPYSINAATARCITWSFGKPGGEKRTLFRLNQTVHVIMVNNSDEQSEAKTYSSCYAKPVSVETVLKFHCGSSSHTVDKLGQDQRRWSTFSSWLLQTQHLVSVITQRRTRFAFVGSAFRQVWILLPEDWIKKQLYWNRVIFRTHKAPVEADMEASCAEFVNWLHRSPTVTPAHYQHYINFL